MGKRIELNPAWLVGLLSQWVKHGLASELGHLGFASGSSWMRGLKSSPASCIDPTGFAARDFTDLENCLRELDEMDKPLMAAVLMYYKPWSIEGLKAEGYPFGDSTYYHRLHRAHSILAASMDAIKEARQNVIERIVLVA